jgi:hypothetical protein
MRGTRESDSLPLPPKAKHCVDNMDPDYLNTAAYVEKPGIGRIYDYKTHHAKNEELAKRKEEKRRAQTIVDAAKKKIAYESVSSKAFDQWMAQKSLEKEIRTVIKSPASVEKKRLGGKASSGEEAAKLRSEREKQWKDGFGSPASIMASASGAGRGLGESRLAEKELWQPARYY